MNELINFKIKGSVTELHIEQLISHYKIKLFINNYNNYGEQIYQLPSPIKPRKAHHLWVLKQKVNTHVQKCK